MVVKLRLARWGVRNNPFYGIVVANARAPRDGRHLERVGTYSPLPSADGTKHVELDTARIKYWLGVGAQPTSRVAFLLAKGGLMPATPLQAQRVGAVSLEDAKTWRVRVDGKEVTHSEARRLVAPGSSEQRVLDSVANALPSRTKLFDRNQVNMATPPKAPLTEKERVLVLRELMGVY
ncbi:hypothetical protein HDU98_005025 [Podochytrium sp. JEL0797]|nr:hypothetical protein HDU98_005025 [Podochytrium sp. JEL0797]